MRLKIIFLEAVQNYGGARKSTVELAARLSDVHDVQIIDFYGSCKPFTDAAKNKNLSVRIADQRDDALIIQRSRGKFGNIINVLQFIPHWFKLRSAIRGFIEDFNADYVIVNNSKTLSILFNYNKKSFKTLYFARGWFTPLSISRINKFLYRNSVDQFICVSEATRHAVYCGGFAPLDKLYVVHNAIVEDDLSKSRATIAGGDNCFKILHAAGFLPEKGQHVCIEVAKQLKEQNFKFKLILAGLVYKGIKSSNYYEKIVSDIKEFGLEDDVIIVKDQPDVIPYFGACDVVVHPSHTEGLPRVVMEAMCLKKPVIANSVGGVTDYILNGFTGYITRFNNPEDYVKYILQLANNKTQYDFIAQNAYELIKTSFTPKEQLSQLENVFNK